MTSTRDFRRRDRLKYGSFQFADHFLGRSRVDKVFSAQRAKLEQDMLAHFRDGKQRKGKILPLDAREDLSFEAFRREYFEPGIPVVMKGAASDWPCCREWNLQYFRDLHGDDEIVMAEESGPDRPYEKLTLRDVIDSIRTGGSKYYRFYPLLRRHPEHLADFDIKWLRQRRNTFSVSEAFWVFIGGENTYTPLHNAYLSNLFVQTYGIKKWILYPMYYAPVVDPAPVRNIYRNAPRKTGAEFNPYEPDYDSYPLYEYIDGWEVELEPGDVLWNPPYVWHSIKNLSDSIGVGYRWLAPSHCFKLSPLYALLDLFAHQPPVWKSVQLYTQDFHLLRLAEEGLLEEYLEEQKLADLPGRE